MNSDELPREVILKSR